MNNQKIHKGRLPQDSLLHTYNSDYQDSFVISLDEISMSQDITAKDLVKSFFTSIPDWISKMMILRNNIVRKLGIKAPKTPKNKEEILAAFTCQKGEKIGLFEVLESTEQEVILGENDKHLDFRISMYLHSSNDKTKSFVLTTSVKKNNWFGHVYFFIVKPFHKIVVPSSMKAIARDLQSRK